MTRAFKPDNSNHARVSKERFFGVPRAHDSREREKENEKMRVKLNEVVYTTLVGFVFFVLLILVTRIAGIKII